MTVTLNHKIYAALIGAAIVVAAIVVGAVWSGHKIEKLEREVETAKQDAENFETASRELEQRAAEYKQKIEYLESSLSEIETIAKKQDEKLKQMANDTNSARDGVRRARALRTVESTNAELCTKLAELGHPCG